jgi:hypothetical protein
MENGNELVKVWSENNEMDAALTKGFLENNGINGVQLDVLADKTAGGGGAPHVSLQPRNILVPISYAQKAKELILNRGANEIPKTVERGGSFLFTLRMLITYGFLAIGGSVVFIGFLILTSILLK